MNFRELIMDAVAIVDSQPEIDPNTPVMIMLDGETFFVDVMTYDPATSRVIINT